MALLTNINGKFSVSDAGAVTFNNAFTFPTTDGTANYVLKTNGSGTVSWSPDSSPTVYWAANGNDIYNTNSANVGIGTNSPTSPTGVSKFLHISGSPTAGIVISDSDNADYNWDIWNSGGGLFMKYNDTTFGVCQLSSGNVGIGNTSPATKLSVGSASHTSPDDTNRILNWYTTTGGAEINNSNYYITVGQDSNSTSQPTSVGLALFNPNTANNTYSPALTFGGLSTSGDYMTGAAAIATKLIASSDTNFRGGDLKFYTSGITSATIGLTEKMVINTQGNVGVGTDSPGARIDIKGVAGSPATSGTTQNGILRIQNATNNNTLDIGQVAGSPYGTWLQAADKSDLNPTYTYPILLNPNGGNVGIGNTSTEGKLTISYTAAELPTSGTTSNSAIQVISSLGNQLNLGLNTVSGDYGAYIQASDNNLAVPYPLNLQPNGGNVGIGTSSPANKLHIIANTAGIEYDTGAGVRVDNAASSPDVSIMMAVSSTNNIGIIQTLEPTVSWSTKNLAIQPRGGNVGIGSGTTGLGKLEIQQTATTAGLWVQTGGTTSSYTIAEFRTGTNFSALAIKGDGNSIFGGTLTTGGSAVINGNQTTTGNFTLNGNQTILRTTPTITLEGRNSGNSGAKLQFLGWANTHKNWELGNGMAGQGFQFRASATAGSTNFSTVAVINSGTGVYTATSDINKKKDFEDSEIGLKEVMKLKPKLFRMKTENENSDKHLGFIAQEVKKVIPQAYLEENGENDEKFIGLQDRPIIAALTKAIQELKAEIELLKNK